jgi:GT2 family glycosyltransferase
METRFERVFASSFYTIDCLIPVMEPERIKAIAPDDFIPGGMCMAYRRSIWERAGGFAEWSRKGQDRLFGRRIRRIGGKLAFTLDARVFHHMPKSMGSLVDRHYFYELWAARQRLSNQWIGRVGLFYLIVTLLVLAALRWPWTLLAAAGLMTAYIHRRTWRKMRLVSNARSFTFDWRDKLLAIPILFVFDAASLAGWFAGTVDRLFRTRWRRLTNRYLEQGC